jgi:hypothetical protein
MPSQSTFPTTTDRKFESTTLAAMNRINRIVVPAKHANVASSAE